MRNDLVNALAGFGGIMSLAVFFFANIAGPINNVYSQLELANNLYTTSSVKKQKKKDDHKKDHDYSLNTEEVT